MVVSYIYVAWGKTLSVTGTLASTVGAINPMCYRDYYLDSETGYYYLQSRYYNPDICRFINADEPAMLALSAGNVRGANLFAYCQNNPVNFVDPTGNWMTFQKAKQVLYIYILLRFPVAFANYNYNSNNSRDIKSGYINGQGKGKVSKLRFGAFNMSYNGCEVIAVYNALQMKGKGVPISQIALEMEINGSSLLFGIFGTNVYFIGNYLSNHGIKYSRATNENAMKKLIKNNGIYIISFWNSKSVFGGIHTVAFRYKNGVYAVYNFNNDITHTVSKYSLSSIYSGGSFIVGYYLS